jgi:hypothetical protein
LKKASDQGSGRSLTTDSGNGKQGKRVRSKRVMKMLKRLQNPYFLVGQGFVLGGALFFATHPESLLASPSAANPADSAVSILATPR